MIIDPIPEDEGENTEQDIIDFITDIKRRVKELEEGKSSTGKKTETTKEDAAKMTIEEIADSLIQDLEKIGGQEKSIQHLRNLQKNAQTTSDPKDDILDAEAKDCH